MTGRGGSGVAEERRSTCVLLGRENEQVYAAAKKRSGISMLAGEREREDISLWEMSGFWTTAGSRTSL